jgi:hypothetical protein
MNVSISICPTEMEFNDGSRYDEQALLDAIREFVMQRHPEARIATLQIGHRQGDAWARVDGDDEAGGELLAAFWEGCGDDEGLFVSDPQPVSTEPTRHQIAALRDEAAAAGDDAMRTICAAALDGDPVAAACERRRRRMTHGPGTWKPVFDLTTLETRGFKK